MRLVVSHNVHQAIDSFYDAAILRHWHSLSYETVEQKKNRLYDGLASLEDYAFIFPKARLKKEWMDAGWQEFICEDFHFAYECTQDCHGEDLVIIHDAVHSLLYH